MKRYINFALRSKAMLFLTVAGMMYLSATSISVVCGMDKDNTSEVTAHSDGGCCSQNKEEQQSENDSGCHHCALCPVSHVSFVPTAFNDSVSIVRPLITVMPITEYRCILTGWDDPLIRPPILRS